MFNVKQCVNSAAVSSITTFGQEVAKQGIYTVKGGKESYLTNNANEKMNKHHVLDEKDQKSTLDGFGELKNIDKNLLNAEISKAGETARPTLMTSHNIHVLGKGDLMGLLAMDVSPSLNGPRNEKRVLMVPDSNGNHKMIGYLPDHNYKDFDTSKGIAQHDHFKTAVDKVQSLVGFIETSTIKPKEDEED